MTRAKPKHIREKRESGMPGCGTDRKDEIGRSGVVAYRNPPRETRFPEITDAESQRVRKVRRCLTGGKNHD